MPELYVPSIHCGSCVEFINELLAPVPGVRDLVVDPLKRTLSFASDESATPSSSSISSQASLLRDVRHLLRDAGYEVQQPSRESRVPAILRRGLFNRRTSEDVHKEHCRACRGEGELQSVAVVEQEPTVHETTFSVGGMTCSSCTQAITSHVLSLPGVVSANVNLVLNSAVVVHDINGISPETLRCEIDDVGFEATMVSSNTQSKARLRQSIFGVEGMTCASCTQSIESTLSTMEGVSSVVVNLMQNSMTIVHDPDRISEDKIRSTVEDTGFHAVIWESKEISDSGQSDASSYNRTIQVRVDGMFCDECPKKVNAFFNSFPLISYSPLSMANNVAILTYEPSASLTIRHLLDVPEPFQASLYQPPSLFARSRVLQANEAKKLAILFAISALFTVPTFIIGIVGMVALPKSHPFREWCERPVWGGASMAVVILGPLATATQFGVGHVFYKRALAGFHSRRGQKWKWSKLVHFGNMDLLVALSTTVAWVASVVMMLMDVKKGRPQHGMQMHDMEERETMTYFDSSVFLIFFILMGRVLEGRAKVKTGDAIAMLGSLRPETAVLVLPYEKQESSESNDLGDLGKITTKEVSVDLLEVGDEILLRPGGIPAADGTIVRGSTTADESSLTGESLPVTKQPGDPMLTGSTNLTSPVIVRIDKVGDETVLQKIVTAVSEAQGRKAPIEHLADRITSVFVPIVVWLALAILITWLSVSVSGNVPLDMLQGRTSNGDRVFFAFEFAIAVLVVACPCGIGLAAPTAQTVGAGMAARLGVLAKGGGEAFQLASRVDTVVFDKTGTLTTGTMAVSDVQEDSSVGSWIWTAVRMLEEGSGHPLAKAIVEYCYDRASNEKAVPESEVNLLNAQEISGRGLQGVVHVHGVEYNILVGNEAMVGASAGEDVVEDWKSKGYSVVLVAISQSFHHSSAASTMSDSSGTAAPSTPSFRTVLKFAISDTPRSDAASTIMTLKKAGKDVYMLSGDNPKTAVAVARGLGIPESNVIAGVLPHEKAEYVTQLKERKKVYRDWRRWGKEFERNSTVLFCGDGLNDTAALAAADVGVALAHGSQITLSTASFVLLSTSSSLTSLASLLNLSRRVYNRQKINFAWAMIYNVGMIPLAAGAFYPLPSRTRLPPALSALAMALSSGSVVLSSLALKWGF